MRLKAIHCQVLTREMSCVASQSPHSIETEIMPMGLHDLGASMRSRLQERIDASDQDGYDAILLGYALCGRGTEGLHAGKTQVVLPRAHDCIGLLMGGRREYQTYFDTPLQSTEPENGAAARSLSRNMATRTGTISLSNSAPFAAITPG